jgi:hypothetical protein
MKNLIVSAQSAPPQTKIFQQTVKQNHEKTLRPGKDWEHSSIRRVLPTPNPSVTKSEQSWNRQDFLDQEANRHLFV